jgi:hypothetical protein
MAQVWHYVYYSYEPWGRGYIGKRSSRVPPEEDKYMGSFRDKTFKPTEKTILATFDTSEDAIAAEILLHNFYEVDKNPHFANRSRQTSSGFVFKREGKGSFYEGRTEQEKFLLRKKLSDAQSTGAKGYFYYLRHQDGKILVTTNLAQTCREHGLHQGNLGKVLCGLRRHSGNWIIEKRPLL